MSKRLSAFFKFAVVCAAVANASAFAAKPTEDADYQKGADPLASLPSRELHLSERAGKLRVGDTISYEIRGGDANAEARWQIDPKQGGLKQGILFRPGKLITPLVAGHFQAPALVVVDDKGTPVAHTDPIEFDVASNLPPQQPGAQPAEQPKPEPAIGPIGLPFPLWVQSVAGSAILFVVLALAFFIVRAIKRRATRALKAILPKKPYDVASLEKIDDLLKKGLLEKKNYKAFYFGISETLKFYLGERFDFEAQESTTSELFSLMHARSGNPGLNEGLIIRLERLFDQLDPVKFADVVPSDGEARSVHREAKEIILASRKITVDPIGSTVTPTVGQEKR